MKRTYSYEIVSLSDSNNNNITDALGIWHRVRKSGMINNFRVLQTIKISTEFSKF